jgi:cyclopropane-fatty-acyl-phospholipid synthase
MREEMPMIGYIQKSAEHSITDLLAGADIRVNGDRPWDIRVGNSDFFDRVIACGSLALGESYMDGWWNCEALDHFFFKMLHHRLHRKIRTSPPVLLHSLKARLFNCQSRRRAFQVGERHYDIGNDLFERMLDRNMTYSCGYWNGTQNLDEAQEAKLDLICRKLGPEAGHART